MRRRFSTSNGIEVWLLGERVRSPAEKARCQRSGFIGYAAHDEVVSSFDRNDGLLALWMRMATAKAKAPWPVDDRDPTHRKLRDGWGTR